MEPKPTEADRRGEHVSDRGGEECIHGVPNPDESCMICTYPRLKERAEQAERALADFKHEYNAMMGRYEAHAAEQTQQIHADHDEIITLRAILESQDDMEACQRADAKIIAGLRAALAQCQEAADERLLRLTEVQSDWIDRYDAKCSELADTLDKLHVNDESIVQLRATLARRENELAQMNLDWIAETNALTAERDGLRTCKECGLLEPERLCRQCHNAACESEADGLRAALERAHACATLLDDGTCAGCFVSAALGRPEKENP
jgi:hypothetical protein